MDLLWDRRTRAANSKRQQGQSSIAPKLWKPFTILGAGARRIISLSRFSVKASREASPADALPPKGLEVRSRISFSFMAA
jgi:hypothetical protein